MANCKNSEFVNSMNICNECNPGYYTTNQRTQCFPCAVECAECRDSAATCTRCSKRHYMASSGRCDRCGYGCADCRDTQFCNVCDSGFYKAGEGKCAACIPNCASCTDASNCDSCAYSYELTTENGRKVCAYSNTGALVGIIIGSIFGGLCILCCCGVVCCAIFATPVSQNTHQHRDGNTGGAYEPSARKGELQDYNNQHNYNNYNNYQSPQNQYNPYMQGNYTLMGGQPGPAPGYY